MKKAMISSKKFTMRNFFAVVAIFTLVALLFMIEKVAETVVNAGNSAGINMPVVPVFRQAAADMFMIGTGIILTIVAGMILIPIVKFSVAVAGLALIGYGIYQLYKLVTGKPVTMTLPNKK